MSMRTLVQFVFLATLLGCGDSTTGPTLDSVRGTWTLETINGSVVPLDRSTHIVDSAVVMLDASGTASFRYYAVYNESSVVGEQPIVSTGSGVFTLEGANVTFTWSGGRTRTGSFSGSTLTTVAPETFSNVNTDVWRLKKR